MPPTEAFVPLTATPTAAGNASDFRLLVVSSPEGARPFRAQSPPTAAVPQPAQAKPGCEPQVLLQRDGDRVTGIHIRCSCGQVIDLACVYQVQGQ
jgi:hypothetical protein